MLMTMDNLFNSLPRDLQWEILETFVGTHVVRNGKLMRKMTGKIQENMMKKMRWYSMSTKFTSDGMLRQLCLKCNPIQTNTYFTPFDNMITKTFVQLAKWKGRQIYVSEMPETGNIIYDYTTPTCDFTLILNDSIILPPFVKHEYPSYPYTDKKMDRPSKKVAFYNIKMTDTQWKSKYHQPLN
jgi:hypothetical protein